MRVDYEVNLGGRTVKVYNLKPNDIIDGGWMNRVSSRLNISLEDIEAISYRR